MTNAAGMWQAIARDFGGMVTALNTDSLTFKPCLPKEFQRIHFQAEWQGQRFDVMIKKNTLALKNLSDAVLYYKVMDQSCQSDLGRRFV